MNKTIEIVINTHVMNKICHNMSRESQVGFTDSNECIYTYIWFSGIPTYDTRIII